MSSSHRRKSQTLADQLALITNARVLSFSPIFNLTQFTHGTGNPTTAERQERRSLRREDRAIPSHQREGWLQVTCRAHGSSKPIQGYPGHTAKDVDGGKWASRVVSVRQALVYPTRSLLTVLPSQSDCAQSKAKLPLSEPIFRGVTISAPHRQKVVSLAQNTGY